jgi:hypothetical protein
VIREVAIAPELLPAWIRSGQALFIVNQINHDTGNFFSRFPKNWKRRVYELYSTASDSKKTRLEVLLKHLWEHGVDRSANNDHHLLEWIASALADHARVPFDLILAHGSQNDPTVVDGTDPIKLAGHPWSARTSLRVKRTIADITKVAAPLLVRSTQVQFADIHFRLDRAYTELLRSFIQCALTNRPRVGARCQFVYHIGYHFSGRHEFEPSDHVNKRDRIVRDLPKFLPLGASVEFHFWKEIRRGAFHNRYILTNIGGINFSAGLDAVADQDHEAYDDLSLMNRDQYNAIISRFSDSHSPELEHLEKVIVIGQRS